MKIHILYTNLWHIMTSNYAYVIIDTYIVSVL